MPIQFETFAMEDSLATALNVCMTSGGNARTFLRELCSHCLAPYTQDSSLSAALEALQQARKVDPSSGAWWQHPPPGGFLVRPKDCSNAFTSTAYAEHALRVKMSEYLCLTAYLEALDVIEERLPENQCLGERYVRECLQASLQMLDEGSCFS